ncbi:Nucleolar GTP-binding protein 2 [Diplonema papillatum]|nr:Nucleolar GTP-binding protein 2 [Diplonema papillatum]
MGKMGKKAGAAVKKKTGVTIPPTQRRTMDPKKQGHLRTNRVTSLLNMRKQKIVRDKKTGEIIKGSALDHNDKNEKGKMARIAPDRKWFGASHVIGQDAMQTFKDVMGKKLNDPYSVLIKPSKLPLALLEEPKSKPNLLERKELNFKETFGKSARRKRVQLKAQTINELNDTAEQKRVGYAEMKDRQLLKNVELEKDPLAPTGQVARDMTADRTGFVKGQSGRIWNELWKVIDSSDVILQVLDARDPMGTRSKYIENYLKTEKKFKHLVFILNKVDLVPTWVTARWLQILSKDRPTIAFHGSMENPFGKGNLINLLRQFSRLHGAVKGKKGGKKTVSVGLIGYPNVGKSSVINTIRNKKVCKVAPIPGETKVWQYVNLSKSIFLIDCPGVIHDSDHKNNDVQAVLKGIVRVERIGEDKEAVIQTILEIIKKEDLMKTYEIKEEWESPDDFLDKIAIHRGKLLRGGVPDRDIAGRMVVNDWIRGRLPWFNAPPFESNQQYRDHEMEDESVLLRKIQNFSTFNIINHELKSRIQQEAEGIEVGDDENEEDEESDELSEPDEDAPVPEVDEEPSDADEEEEAGAPAATKRGNPKQGGAKKRKAEPAQAAPAANSAWEALKAAAVTSKPAAADSSVKRVRLVRKK